MPPVRGVSRGGEVLIQRCRGYLVELETRKLYNETIKRNHPQPSCGNVEEDGVTKKPKNPLILPEDPSVVAREVLKPMQLGQPEIQEFLNNVSVFQDLSMEDFSSMELFLSAMMAHVLEAGGENSTLTLDLPGRAPAYLPSHRYALYGLYYNNDEPQVGVNLGEYYRTNLLLGYLGAYHSTGTLILNGNAGSFFAHKASGGKIILNGGCGFWGCDRLEGAEVIINGTTGCKLLSLATSGKVFVNDGIVNGQKVTADVGDLDYAGWFWETTAECYLNGRRIYAVEHRSSNPPYVFDPPPEDPEDTRMRNLSKKKPPR